MRAEKEKKKRELVSTILWSAVLICMIVQIALPEHRCIGDGKRRSLCSFVFWYRRKLCMGNHSKMEEG